jgi:hypothetical protein
MKLFFSIVTILQVSTCTLLAQESSVKITSMEDGKMNMITFGINRMANQEGCTDKIMGNLIKYRRGYRCRSYNHV